MNRFLAFMLLNNMSSNSTSLDQELEMLSRQPTNQFGGSMKLLAILSMCSGFSLRTIIVLLGCSIFAVGGILGFAIGKLI